MHKVRYSDVARNLTEGIASGQLPVGSLLPTEHELSVQFATSRYTVRAALAELQQLGLLSRKKNVGTRIERNAPIQGYQQTLTSVGELAQFGATHSRKVKKVCDVVADIELAEELGCEGGTRWCKISSLRVDNVQGQQPIGWTDAYIDAAYSAIADSVRRSPQTLISSLIETRFGRRVAHVRQEVGAISLPPRLARALQAEPGSPALKIVRRYSDSSRQIFEVTVTVHPSDRFKLSMQMARSDA